MLSTGLHFADVHISGDYALSKRGWRIDARRWRGCSALGGRVPNELARKND